MKTKIKLLKVLSLQALFMITYSGAFSQPKLSSATISFITPSNTDDKDWNTNLTVSLYLSDGTLVGTAPYSTCNDSSPDNLVSRCFCCAKQITDAQGHITNPKTMFDDNGKERGPFDIVISNKVQKQAIKTGYFTVKMKPVGNDRWIFIPKLFLTFDDNTKLSFVNYSNTAVTQDAPMATLIFNWK